MPSASENFDFSHLSVAERILLVERLWDSIATDTGNQALPLSEAQRNELESRCAALDNAEMKTIPWEEARRSLFSGE